MNRLLQLCLAFYCASLWAAPIDVPAPQDIIDALTPIKTRGLRNLVVSQKPGSDTSAESAPDSRSSPPARPSISLAIVFDFNSAKISRQSETTLRNLASALESSQLSNSRFLIEGHTDAKGSASYNQRLSLLRADAVRNWLCARGLSGNQLDAVGKGADEPANPDDPLAAENRRVRIVNLD